MKLNSEMLILYPDNLTERMNRQFVLIISQQYLNVVFLSDWRLFFSLNQHAMKTQVYEFNVNRGIALRANPHCCR